MSSRSDLSGFLKAVAESDYVAGEATPEQIAYLPVWSVVTAPFPQVKPQAAYWKADAGKAGQLEVGLLSHKLEHGIPFGISGRWALILLCMAAHESSSGVTRLGHPIMEIAKLTGRSPGGGPVSGIEGLRRAFLALLHTDIKFVKGRTSHDVSPVLSLEYPAPNGRGKIDPLRIKILRLNQNFLDGVRFGIPVHLGALRLLGNDSLAWDLLVFLAWRVRGLETEKRSEVIVRWVWLHQQLGSRQKALRVFRQRVRIALRKVSTLYPGLAYEAQKEGLLLRPSPRMFVLEKSSDPMEVRAES